MSIRAFIFISYFILIFPRTLDEAQISQIDKVIQERMGTVKLNKFGIIIVNSTSIIHQKVFGEGITTKSRFPLASVTKSFTALGILKLDIPLNQTIDNYNLGNYIDEDLAKQITVEDLLTQSSGLDRNSRKQVGKKGDFIYSNYGYSLLGKIIEDQSKEKNYAGFIKKNILDELNMTESGLDFVNDFIDSYDNFFGFLTKYNNLESEYTKDNGFDIPAGYIRSTLEDMGKYLQGYFGINKNYIQKMGIPKTNIDYNLYYGMGLFIRNKNGKYIYDHSGVIKSFLTHMYIYPDDDLAYFIFTNTNDGLCPGPFYSFMNILESLILDNVISYEQTFTLLDNAQFIANHFAIDLIIIIIIAIPLTYLIITIVRKFKKKKPMWFDGVKGIIIFIVDILFLIILPVILLAFFTEQFKSTRDFIFCLLSATSIMITTFIVKLIYFFSCKKYFRMKSEELYDKIDDNREIFDSNE